MSIDERMSKIVQRRFGYTDEEMTIFKENPRNAEVLAKGTEIKDTTFVLEFVEAHGCNSRHKVGEKFYIDGAGNLLVDRCSKNICIQALGAAATLIFAAQELIYAGIDPNEMRFKRAGCIDVGLACGGWGRVVVELRAEEEKEVEKIGS
jgi:uncharacterized repeat protein (TIGR04076 family)